jgi:hypothetical protein
VEYDDDDVGGGGMENAKTICETYETCRQMQKIICHMTNNISCINLDKRGEQEMQMDNYTKGDNSLLALCTRKCRWIGRPLGGGGGGFRCVRTRGEQRDRAIMIKQQL